MSQKREEYFLLLIMFIFVYSLYSPANGLNTLRTGRLNLLNVRSRGLKNLNQRLYCVSLNIYNKFANYFCELKVSGNTHQRP